MGTFSEDLRCRALCLVSSDEPFPYAPVVIDRLEPQCVGVERRLHEVKVLAFAHEPAGSVVRPRATGTHLNHALMLLYIERDDVRAEVSRHAASHQHRPELLAILSDHAPR